MGEVHEIFGGKKLTPEEIEKMEDEKTSVKPIPKREVKEIWDKAGDIADKLITDWKEKVEKNEDK